MTEDGKDDMRAQVRATVNAHIREVVPPPFEDGSALEDLGLDSLDRCEMAISLEDKFQIDLGDTWDTWVTVSDIHYSVERALGDAAVR